MTTREYSEKTLKKYYDAFSKLGSYQSAADLYGIKKETIRRCIREYKNRNEVDAEKKPDEKIIRQIREKFSDSELKRILAGSEINPDHSNAIHDFEGEEITIGALTDTHLGSKYTDPTMVLEAFEQFAKFGIDFMVHCGDVTEGLSHRPGHMYECNHIGYSAQLDHSREIFEQWTETPIYMIDGNHDRWYIKSNGAIIVDELCRGQENLNFIGHDEGDIEIGPVTIKLWHGEDGSSYAFSYRVQKIIESFTGGEKPNVLICGHTHKANYFYDRHVHAVSAGSMQRQSKWMRGKRQQSHYGFFIIKLAINDTGVAWFEPRFFPFYR